MGEIGLELKEIALIFDVTPETLSRYQRKHPEIRQAYRRGRARTCKDLKLKALRMALDKENVDMLKHCLKHMTDWKDGPLVEINDNRETHVTNIVLPGSEEELNKQIAERTERIAALRKFSFPKGSTQ